MPPPHPRPVVALDVDGVLNPDGPVDGFVTHLIHILYAGDLFDAVRKAVRRLHGAYAIAVVSKKEPHVVVGARAGNPLVVGLGKGENFLASDALALAGTTDRIAYLEEGDVARIDLRGWQVVDHADRPA